MLMPFPIPLSALRAIEIVARRGALGPAAEELGVTAGAVSQHIRRAEKRLGITLFERTSAGLVPSAALSAQLPRLGEGFSMLASALSAPRPDHGGVLTVTLGSVFASRFLVGRLARFSAEHPDLELRLIANGALLDLGRPDIDCGIRFGNGKWPGTTATLLGGIVALPVCTPSLARQLGSPADLAHVPVIRDESTMLAWRDWLAGAGADPELKLNGPTAFTDPALAFEAAISGQGVLLAVDLMAADALRLGQLIAPFPQGVQLKNGYWFTTAEVRTSPRRVRLFHDWLVRQIAECQQSGASRTDPMGL